MRRKRQLLHARVFIQLLEDPNQTKKVEVSLTCSNSLSVPPQQDASHLLVLSENLNRRAGRLPRRATRAQTDPNLRRRSLRQDAWVVFERCTGRFVECCDELGERRG